MRPWWRRYPLLIVAVAVAAAAAIAVTVAALSRSAGTGPGDLRLDNPGGFEGGGAVPDIRLGTSYMYLLMPLCTADGPVTITGVTPHDPVGTLTVVDWAAVRDPRTQYADAIPGRASDLLGPDESTSTITWRCSTQNAGHASAFAIGIELSTPRAVAHGWDVHSTSGTVYIPFTIAECTASICPYPKDG